MADGHYCCRGLMLLALCGSALQAQAGPPIIVAQDAVAFERLAAREIRRYVYLRTGDVAEIVEDGRIPAQGDVIVVGLHHDPLIANLKEPAAQAPLGPQEFLLRTIHRNGRELLLIVGGDGPGLLYGAYRFAEHLGVRFLLEGDVIPEGRIRLSPLPKLMDRGRPLFELRGIQPFHDFPEGPDWWNEDHYKSVITQLPKLGMNFIALHTYPEGGPNAEPTVWIGPSSELGEDGRVKTSYPSSYQNTFRGNWGYAPKDTGDYTNGAADLFEQDAYGVDAMAGYCPQPTDPEGCNTLFERTADMLSGAFSMARRLGVKTCVGTEAPLTIPAAVRERLAAQGKDPASPETLREIYEGIFRRIMARYPINYYWFWTPEGWTWGGNDEGQLKATVADIQAAIDAADAVNAPFSLATCGWVLGPADDRALFDRLLPKELSLSCINRQVGYEPVDPAFADVTRPGKWAIPWLEDDPALTAPQLWVGRMRQDAFDARRYGCNGLMGIHWRTRILGPNVSALAHAAWDQSGWRQPAGVGRAAVPAGEPGSVGRAAVPAGERSTPRGLPADDFYLDWARALFGEEVGSAVAAIFTAVDGRLPVTSQWIGGPGGQQPDARPWDTVKAEFQYVSDMEALEPRVKGAGNRARFAYWLAQFRYMRAQGKMHCTWAEYNAAVAAAKAEPDPARQAAVAREKALPLRRQLVALVEEIYSHLLATVSSPGEMGTIMNWEQHILPGLLAEPGKELASLLGEDLPPDAQPRTSYRGPVRVIVPTVRTSLAEGEGLDLRVLVLSESPAEVSMIWRPFGTRGGKTIPAQHVARRVYRIALSANDIATKDFEYVVRARAASGRAAFPDTAPDHWQTVVVIPKEG